MSSRKKGSKSTKKPEPINPCVYCSKPVLRNNMSRHIYTTHPEHDQRSN